MYHGRILSQTIKQSNAGASRKMVEIAGTSIPILMRRRQKKLVPRVPPNEFPKMITFKRRKADVTRRCSRWWLWWNTYMYIPFVFLYTANSIHICILICKYVIHVMDLWMICYWGTILNFCDDNKLCKRPANWQPGKKSENVYTHRFTARCFWFIFEYVFKDGWSTSELCGWLVFFFNLYIFYGDPTGKYIWTTPFWLKVLS